MGKSKKVTVGYKYYVGMHMVLCHGPVDSVSAIEVDGRTAWSGSATGGSVTINAPDLFGGESRTGINLTILSLGLPGLKRRHFVIG